MSPAEVPTLSRYEKSYTCGDVHSDTLTVGRASCIPSFAPDTFLGQTCGSGDKAPGGHFQAGAKGEPRTGVGGLLQGRGWA